MNNTIIRLTYRTASNYKTHDEVVFRGAMTDEEISTISRAANEGFQVIAGEVGLPNLAEELILSLGYEEDDFVAHLELDDWIMGPPAASSLATDKPATTNMTSAELANRVAAAPFNIGAAMERLEAFSDSRMDSPSP